MVTQTGNECLILAAAEQSSDALDQFAAHCGWPRILQATPRKLRDELAWSPPGLSLLWLDDPRDLAASVRLLDWLRTCHPAVRRLAVTYRLPPGDIEPALRAAAVHAFLAIDGPLHAAAESLRSNWTPQATGLRGRTGVKARAPTLSQVAARRRDESWNRHPP